MLIAGTRHLRAVLEQYVRITTGIARTEPEACDHPTVTTSTWPRSPA
jgi:hypothetical protein